MAAVCPECGYMHPPVAPGACPMAKAKKIKEEHSSQSNTKVMNMSLDIQKAYLAKAQKITDENTKIELGRKILNFINTTN